MDRDLSTDLVSIDFVVAEEITQQKQKRANARRTKNAAKHGDLSQTEGLKPIVKKNPTANRYLIREDEVIDLTRVRRYEDVKEI